MWTPADWAWAGGLFNIMFPALYYGVPLLACTFTKFDPEEVFALMEEAGVRNVFIPPTALRMLRAVENPSQRFKLSLRTIASGGETLGRETLAWGRDELGLTINEFYGQTECNYVLASCAAIGVVKPGSIGKAVPGHVVGIIDEAGNELGTGEQGQIAIKRPDPNMFLEYWQRPDASEEKFIGDWMTTGDQGMIDEDGYVSFVGRDDDVITSAGYRIGPGEIEDCLIKHPAVHLAAAVGIPDPVRTEIVKAFIVLKEGFEQSPELEKELGAFVREHLSAHEYPREIAFIDEMPLTTTGKIIRRLLRDQT
jgi:acetyl-CoA synthetase